MIFLRILGFLVAVGLLGSVIRRRRRRALGVTDTAIYALLAGALAVIAVVPSIVDPTLELLGFPPGNQRRVIGVLLVSNIVTYILILRSFAKTDRVEGLLGDYADRLAARLFAWEYDRDGASSRNPKLCV
ncbi:MAG: DUF2304 family protein, partial [Actinomycetota bacterium]